MIEGSSAILGDANQSADVAIESQTAAKAPAKPAIVSRGITIRFLVREFLGGRSRVVDRCTR
jgi:hypothetical protein